MQGLSVGDRVRVTNAYNANIPGSDADMVGTVGVVHALPTGQHRRLVLVSIEVEEYRRKRSRVFGFHARELEAFAAESVAA